MGVVGGGGRKVAGLTRDRIRSRRLFGLTVRTLQMRCKFQRQRVVALSGSVSRKRLRRARTNTAMHIYSTVNSCMRQISRLHKVYSILHTSNVMSAMENVLLPRLPLKIDVIKWFVCVSETSGRLICNTPIECKPGVLQELGALRICENTRG